MPSEPVSILRSYEPGKKDISSIRAALAAAAKGERMKKIARDLIGATKVIFARVRGYGLNLDDEKVMFKNAIVAIKSEEYVKGSKITTRLKRQLEAKEENYFIDEAGKSLDEAGELMEESRDLGFDMQTVEGALTAYAGQLDNREFDRAEIILESIREYSQTAISEMNGQIMARLSEIIPNELARLTEKFEEAKELLADTGPEQEKISSVEEMRQSGNDREAYVLIKNVKESLDTKITGKLVALFSGQLAEQKELLASLEIEAGHSYPEIDEQAERVLSAIKEENIGSLPELLDELRLTRESARDSYLFEKLSLQVRDIEEDIEQLKELGIDVAEPEGLLGTVNEQIVGNEFGLAQEQLPRLKEIVNNAKTVEARRLASTLLASTKKLYSRLGEANVEMGEAKNTFKEGIIAIKSQDFVKGCIVLGKVKAALEEIDGSYLSEVLSSRLEAATKFYEVFEKKEYFAEAHKEEVKKLLEEAGILLEDGKLQDAQERMKAYGEMEGEIQLRDQRFKDATALSEKLAETRAFAEELGIEIDEILIQYTEASENMKDFMFEEAIGVYEQVDMALSEKIQEKLRENAVAKLEEATEIFLKFREHFTEPERIDELLAKARLETDNKDHNESIATSEEAIRLITRSQEDKLIEDTDRLFSEFLVLVDECEMLGVDVLQPEARLFKAKTAYERRDYETAYELGSNALEEALGKRKEFHKEKAREVNRDLAEMLQEAEQLSIDYSPVLGPMNEAKKLFSSEMYVEAREMSEKAREPLQDMLNEKLKEIIARDIVELKGTMEEALRLSVDIVPEKRELGGIAPLKEEGRYKDAIDLIKGIKESLRAKISGDFKERSAMKRDGVDKRFAMMEGERCPIDDARNILGEASTMMGDGRYRECIEVLDRAAAFGEELWMGFQQERCLNLIKDVSELLSEVVNVTGGKVDLGPPTELLDQATATLKEKDFEKARSEAQEAHSQADRLYYHFVIDSLLGTHDFLLEVKNLGADVSKSQEMFTAAKLALEKKEYDTAIDRSNQAMSITKEARLDFMRDDVDKNLKVVTSIASKLKAKGIDVLKLEEAVDGVLKRMEEEDVENGFRLSKDARSLSADFRDDFKKTTVDIMLSDCNELIHKLDGFGIDSNDVRDRLAPTVDLIEGKKFPEALRIAKESHTVLQERYDSHYKMVLTGAIEETKIYLEEISEFVDVTRPGSVVKEAEEALARNDFNECKELNDKARSLAEKSRHASLIIEAANVLAYTGETIREGGVEGMDVAELNTKLMEASEAFENREYPVVIELCATIGAVVDKFKSDKLSNIAKEAVRTAKTMIESARSIKANVKGPTEKYKEAMSRYKEGKYKDSLDSALETQELAKYQKDLKATTTIMDFVRTSIDEMEGNGVDVSEAQSLLVSVDPVIEKGDFEKAIEIARDTVKNAMSHKLQHSVSEGIERSREYVSFALDNDVFVKDYFQGMLEGEMEEGKCPNCGKDVPENAMFCLWCGNRLG